MRMVIHRFFSLSREERKTLQTRNMSLKSELHANHGVMRASELLARGYSAHALRSALAAETVIRPQRGWIALPGADPELLFAVRQGAILSCLAVAKREGLWVREYRPHFAVRTRGSNVDTGSLVLHWGRPVRRRELFAALDSIENALNFVARCQPQEEALAIWESALRKGLVTRASLSRYPYVGVARELLEAATPFSDSGVESYVMRRLRALGLRVVAQAYIGGHRVDFLIEGWLVLQIDGGTHVGEQRDEDNRLDAVLHNQGYHTIRAGYWQVMERWPEVQGWLMEALSQGADAMLRRDSRDQSRLRRTRKGDSVRLR